MFWTLVFSSGGLDPVDVRIIYFISIIRHQIVTPTCSSHVTSGVLATYLDHDAYCIGFDVSPIHKFEHSHIPSPQPISPSNP